MKEEKKEYCAITEQGDLGLGAFVLGGEDQKILEESAKEKK